MKVQSIYTNRIFKKGLEFASDNSALFVGTVSLALSTVARPIAIMSTPNTNKENKKYACIKSLASSAVGYGLMLGASLPVSNAIKEIDKNKSKYLKPQTLAKLSTPKKYAFATQLFNLGLGFLIAVPKSILTCALIPPFISKIFPKKENKDLSTSNTNNFSLNAKSNRLRNKCAMTGASSFTGNLSKGIGKLIDTNAVQKLTEKFHNTNFEQHIMCLTDTVATGAFITQTAKNKKIEQDRKKALMYNAGISTGLCIAGSYLIDKALKKPTGKFIENFRKANKNSPKLEKYVEGIRIAKPALILGGIYYIVIPIISTFLADRFDKNKPVPNTKSTNT